jgi:ABC-2 type transport system permease protein
MIRTLTNTTTAELIKLRGLPAVLATLLATVGAAIALTVAIAASSKSTTDPVQLSLLTIPYLQIGPILLGVLTVATEYTGTQIHTTLTATPNRAALLAAKTIAYLASATVISATAISAGLATAAITLTIRDTTPTSHANGWPAVGAILYLVLIGLLAFTLTILLRCLTPPLVTMLSLVLIASPLIRSYTEQARWLPDQAGRLLYLPNADNMLTAGTGTLVLLAWIVATATTATATFLVRDT